MTTVINNPGENRGNENANANGGSGVVIGAVLVVLVLLVAIVLALPYIRERFDGMSEPVNPVINVEVPSDIIPGDNGTAPTE